MEENHEIFKKDNYIFERLDRNKYKLSFDIENNNIYMSQIIDFSLLKLIYDLNPDIYENFKFENINENEGVYIILLKHFFEDIGFPQRYSVIHIKKIVDEKCITFKSQTINSNKPDIVPNEAELLLLENLTCICDIVNPHKINFSININLDIELDIPLYVEKMIGIIIHKIFKRVKQFIEKI